MKIRIESGVYRIKIIKRLQSIMPQKTSNMPKTLLIVT
jgi:hypothetical protein